MGAAADEERSVVVNYGTGSQISFLAGSVPDSFGLCEPLELRPYTDGRFIVSGSALCGGKAYALLERFFGSYVSLCGLSGSQYEILNRLACQEYEYEQGLKGAAAPLIVSTKFCGTRTDPDLRGSIGAIGEDNFTPGALALGVLRGMASELKELYDLALGSTGVRRPGEMCLIASGNAVRRNPVFLRVLSDVFGMRARLSGTAEEAAFGAALFAASIL